MCKIINYTASYYVYSILYCKNSVYLVHYWHIPLLLYMWNTNP